MGRIANKAVRNSEIRGRFPGHNQAEKAAGVSSNAFVSQICPSVDLNPPMRQPARWRLPLVGCHFGSQVSALQVLALCPRAQGRPPTCCVRDAVIERRPTSRNCARCLSQSRGGGRFTNDDISLSHSFRKQDIGEVVFVCWLRSHRSMQRVHREASVTLARAEVSRTCDAMTIECTRIPTLNLQKLSSRPDCAPQCHSATADTGTIRPHRA